MVRSALSPRDDAYYYSSDKDDDFTILTSDFAAKAVVQNDDDEDTENNQQGNVDEPQRKYNAFMSTLDDKQKNAIKVLDTWFQLKSSCMAQMTEMEEGNAALRDAVSRSKSARQISAEDKALGVKLGIGAASINYQGGDRSAEVKPLEEKIVKLENEIVEIRSELDRERAKCKKIKESSSNALKARKKDVEMLRSKLKYYKKENEALQAKLVLYRQALEKAEEEAAAREKALEKAEEEAAAREKEWASRATASVPAPITLPPIAPVVKAVAAPVAPTSTSVAALEREIAEKEPDEKSSRPNTEEQQAHASAPKFSPMKYDRKMLRRKMRNCTGGASMSPKKSTDAAVDESDKPSKKINSESKKRLEAVEGIEDRNDNEVKEINMRSDVQIEEREGLDEEKSEESKEEDLNLTFSDLLAMDHPDATRAPKARPKFNASSTGVFGSASRSTQKQATTNDYDAKEEKVGDDILDAEPREKTSNDMPKQGAVAMARANFARSSGSNASFSLKTPSPVPNTKKTASRTPGTIAAAAAAAAAATAPPSAAAATHSTVNEEPVANHVPPSRPTNEPTNEIGEEALIKSASSAESKLDHSEKVENEVVKEQEPLPPPIESKAPVKSKVASLAASFGSSVRAKRMSFERPLPRSDDAIENVEVEGTPVAPIRSFGSAKKSPAPLFTKKSPIPPTSKPEVVVNEKLTTTDTDATKEDEPETDEVGTEEEPVVDLASDAKHTEEEVVLEEEPVTVPSYAEPLATPIKEATPSEPTASATSIGPGSAQKELEELRSMLRGRGGMANKKRFEVFQRKKTVEDETESAEQEEENDVNKFSFQPDWCKM